MLSRHYLLPVLLIFPVISVAGSLDFEFKSNNTTLDGYQEYSIHHMANIISKYGNMNGVRFRLVGFKSNKCVGHDCIDMKLLRARVESLHASVLQKAPTLKTGHIYWEGRDQHNPNVVSFEMEIEKPSIASCPGEVQFSDDQIPTSESDSWLWGLPGETMTVMGNVQIRYRPIGNNSDWYLIGDNLISEYEFGSNDQWRSINLGSLRTDVKFQWSNRSETESRAVGNVLGVWVAESNHCNYHFDPLKVD